MSGFLEHIFSREPHEKPASPKEAFTEKLATALANYNPLELQELIIEALQEEALSHNPKRFAEEISREINQMCGPEVNPPGVVGPRKGDAGLNVLWKTLKEFSEDLARNKNREALLEAVRALDLQD